MLSGFRLCRRLRLLLPQNHVPACQTHRSGRSSPLTLTSEDLPVATQNPELQIVSRLTAARRSSIRTVFHSQVRTDSSLDDPSMFDTLQQTASSLQSKLDLCKRRARTEQQLPRRGSERGRPLPRDRQTAYQTYLHEDYTGPEWALSSAVIRPVTDFSTQVHLQSLLW